MIYVQMSKEKLKKKILESTNIFLDNDGFLFDNTEKMNDAAIFTLREIFGIDPLTFNRRKALNNLKRFYQENSSVFNRVPWVASQSIQLLEEELVRDGESSIVSEFDIFRMSSRAYGGAFLYEHSITNTEVLERLIKFYKNNPEYYKHNPQKADESISLLKENIDQYRSNLPSVSNEKYIAGGVTSRMVFETYLGIFFCKFDREILPIPGAKELIKRLNNFTQKTGKRFGIISNRSENSLIELLERFNFIGDTMVPRAYITGADPVLGGKPRLHTFRKFIPEKEKVVYFGDLPTDVEVCEVLNQTDGEGTAFCVLIPSKFEFKLDEFKDGINNFTKEQNDFCVCLSYEDILSVVNDIHSM